MTIDQLIASLTPADAVAYNKQTDKYVWVQYTFLDPNDLSRRFTSRVEYALDMIDQQQNPNSFLGA
jgi:hypothetical protein